MPARSTRSSTLELLRSYESQNVTFMDPDGSWPIVWERARGVHVWDEQGKQYLDLTAAFGVAACGHANPHVATAGARQMRRLLHAMGDVHPHRLKAELARELSRVTFERWSATAVPGSGRSVMRAKTIFCSSGFEAVEAALKTAMLSTGKPGVIAFKNAYHGLGYGTLNATHRSHFRSSFRKQLREFGKFVPFPADGPRAAAALDRVEKAIRKQLRSNRIGAVLVEPVQTRGGIAVPPPEFLPLLRRLCDEQGLLLILDEIYTGFGRTGRWFACEHSGVIPDVICLGKALTGGFPLSACVGRARTMDGAWPASMGEAIHTSTFLGHPVGCAMALANIREIERRSLVARALASGKFLLGRLSKLSQTTPGGLRLQARGAGLLTGVELLLPDGAPATTQSLACIKRLLYRGFIFLPEGEHANVISLTPPLTITRKQLATAVDALAIALSEVSR
jgi:4-aminobutyrate aminotransferase-like enzyme